MIPLLSSLGYGCILLKVCHVLLYDLLSSCGTLCLSKVDSFDGNVFFLEREHVPEGLHIQTICTCELQWCVALPSPRVYRALSYTAYTAQKITYNQKNNIISIRKQKNIRKQSTARHTKSRWTPFGYDFGDTAAQARCFGTARLAVLATFVRCQLLWEISLFFIKHTGYFYRRARRGFYTLLYNSNTIVYIIKFSSFGFSLYPGGSPARCLRVR